MKTNLAVAGATGVLGRHVVEIARLRGHDVVTLALSTGVDLVERLRGGPVVITPRMRCQPVAAREVAERLIKLVEAGPSGRVPDFGGPREEQMVDMVREYKAAVGAKGWVLPVPFPGALGRALRDGSLIPAPGADHGTQTFADWLRSGRSSTSADRGDNDDLDEVDGHPARRVHRQPRGMGRFRAHVLLPGRPDPLDRHELGVHAAALQRASCP
jgi:uncharacterized protein YbjT (DUF2867 family)